MREVGMPSFVAQTGWALGEALLRQGDAAGARDVLSEAAEIFERRGQKGQIPEVRARLARALIRLGEVPEARAEAEAARAVAMKTDVESRYIAAVALGEVHEAEGDSMEAEGCSTRPSPPWSRAASVASSRTPGSSTRSSCYAMAAAPRRVPSSI